ncbi:hypothetical protein DYB28_007106 [Aphanomyces astaci]|uniref:SPX domain-containing protein n=4 Tax=Aphanomyces astaci TaxID=112090 RepID=A0A9X8H353_APHAT|nr:hypothetical protein DYB28_007106 [Aphanomyces astaci]
MKFGKQLELTANVQWRQYYVQYKKLKRLIKRVAFEIERGQRKQEKVDKKSKTQGVADLPRPPSVTSFSSSDKSLSLTSSGKSKARASQGGDESTPLLSPQVDLNLDNIEDAKREFWDMTNANIADANEFYRSKVTHLAKIVKDFESMLRDEDKASHGHVSSKPRTTSHEVDRGFAGIQDCYDTLIDLKQFVNLNHTGFRKIVKKFDKTTGGDTLDAFVKQLNHEEFYASHDIDALLERLFSMTSKDKLEAGNLEQRMKRQQGGQDSLLRKVKAVPFVISCVLFGLLLAIPIPGGVQQRCLAMLVFITSLWVSEALPYFATSLLVPVLVVFLRILNDKQHPNVLLDAKSAAKEVTSLLVNHTTILIMGGYAYYSISFSISAALSKCQIELYIAAFLQRRFKKSPRLFLLAIMLMGLFLSMWINNHTAPVLCVSTLLIGLAFACNLGGMMTPIASLQVHESFRMILCWLFLLWAFNPSDVKYIPQIVYDQKQRVTRVHVAVVLLTVSTIVLWALFTLIAPTVGDMSIISLLLMAVQRSGLLGTLSHSLIQALPSGSVWLTTVLLCMLVLGLTTFISHTVASLILLPIIVQLSIEIGQPQIPVISCALAISAVGLAFSLFTVALIVSLGYWLIVLVLGDNIVSV